MVSEGCRQQSPSGTPPRVNRDGQIGPNCNNSSERNCIAFGFGDEMIEKSAGSRCIVQREYFRTLTDEAAKRTKKVGATLEPDQWIIVGDLKTVTQRLGIEVRQCICVDPQLLRAVATTRREVTAREQIETCHGQTLGPGEVAGRHWIVVAPLRAGAGVEQHTDDREIEIRTRSRRRILEVFGKVRMAIESPRHEMPPARVERHVERRIILPHNRQDEIDCDVEAVGVETKIRQLVVEPECQHAMGAVAHRLCVQKRIGSGRFGRHGRGPEPRLNICRGRGRRRRSDSAASAARA
jgi:hypothetical protein